MTRTVYVERKSDKSFGRFLCFLTDDDKSTVAVSNGIVAKDAFKSAAAVENVHFKKCKLIEEFAFENCSDLKNVIWMEDSKKSPKAYGFAGSVKNNDDSIFNGTMTEKSDDKDSPETDNIIGINIPTVPDLGIQRGAFKGCSNLQTVILPKSKDITIEKEVFGGCQNLRTIVFPDENDQTVDISGDTFSGCSKVTFVCSKTSGAYRYAREHGFEIVNIEG